MAGTLSWPLLRPLTEASTATLPCTAALTLSGLLASTACQVTPSMSGTDARSRAAATTV